MRKYSLVITLLVFVNVCFSQNPEIKAELPTVIPPSPTVSALMKFEEVPVSNYTGVPDISIPLFSSPTLSKDINLDISLKYHIAGVAADEKASDVGLGWSLFAGGTISRTVVGLPDEYLKIGDIRNKVGIYHTTHPTNKNNYYEIINGLAHLNPLINSEAGTTFVNPQLLFKLEEFLWETNEKGKYDSEHDVWQYNFMGYSGSFIIKKNLLTSQLEIISLDNNGLKIVNNYQTSSYVPTSFEVYDQKGYKFLFNIIEVSNSTSYSTNSHNIFSHQGLPTIYNSAFHLSEIRDTNNQLLISFNYGTNANKEITISKSGKVSDMLNPPFYDLEAFPNAESFWEPRFSNSFFHVTTNTKKLNQINVNGGPVFEFEYIVGREDENLVLALTNSSYLNSIIMKNQNSSIIKKYKLNYIYNKVIDNRMFLNNVEIYNSNLSEKLTYNLEYNFPNINNNLPYAEDYWGYFNKVPCSFLGNHSDYREVNSTTNKLDLLLKMSLPTGGSIVFNYETNQYSYEGDIRIEDFGEEPDNHYEQIMSLNNGIIVNLNYSANRIQYVTFHPPLTYEQQITQNRIVSLYKDNIFVENISISCPDNNDVCCVTFTLEQGHQYSIKLRSLNSPNINLYTVPLSMLVEYYTTRPSTEKYLNGGGNRVKTIGYFKTLVSKDYYINNSNAVIADKEINYRYNFFNEPLRSSGALVFAKPLYYYYLNKRACAEVYQINDSDVTSYNVYTDYNINPTVNTQGATVGYKNVSVFETGNGRTEYEYTSPIDFPEDVYNYNADNRKTPTLNYDYKRGLLLSEKIFDNNLRQLTEITNIYNYEESEILMGMKVFYKSRRHHSMNGIYTVEDCPISYKYPTYQDYLWLLDHCVEYPYSTNDVPCPEINHWKYGGYPLSCLLDPSGDDCCVDSNGNRGPCNSSLFPFNYIECRCWCYTGNSLDFIGYAFDKKIKGWAKLKSKTTKNYFYPTPTSPANIVQTDETYTYNPLNKKISEQTVTNSFGEVMKTKYFYLTTVDTPTSKNNISTIEKIETYRDAALLSSSKINYVTNFPGNVSYLPQTITTSKGSNALETRVRYNAYDEFSHPLEVQQENGMKISYIYGYNKSQPVAKLENIGYTSIPVSLITAIQTATDSPNSNEAQVIDALNALRTSTDANLQKAMITTYTYKPLIGISTVTDPKGDTQTYHYDEFNRLQFVKDSEDNILSENAYHYRTPN